jgi:MSHA biogenesis protein MshO
MPRTEHSRERGVTLIEMVIVISITAIIAGAVSVFISRPVEGYADAARRAEMSDIADTALRRMTRDVRTALPNSIRTITVGSSYYLEYLETRTGGRYRSEVPAPATATGPNTCPDLAPLDGTADENVLQFGAADTCFTSLGDVLGLGQIVPNSDFVVVYNLGPGSLNADAYASGAVTGGNKSRITAVTSVAGENVFSIESRTFTYASPGKRFHVVSGPVTYECVPSPTGGQLRRYWGYAISAAQVTPPAGGSNALLASNVTACSFTYATSGPAQRTGVVALSLQIQQSGESIQLFQQVHVPNVP